MRGGEVHHIDAPYSRHWTPSLLQSRGRAELRDDWFELTSLTETEQSLMKRSGGAAGGCGDA